VGELVVVRGTVIGDAGKPVAGWVSLGKKQPQRFLSRTLRIESSEGHEMVLEDIDGNEIQPIAKREVKWQELEGTEIGNLCAREAPAPDVEVELREAVARGGDKVAAWGEVLDRGYIGGESQRGSVEGGITKLRVVLLQVGDDCVEKLEARKEAQLAKDRKEEAKYQEKLRKNEESDRAAATPNAPRTPKTPWKAPWVTNPSLFTAVVGIAVFAALGVLTGHHHRFLAGCAAFAFVPRALDAQIVPRFRNGRVAAPSLQVPTIGFAIAGLITIGFPIFGSFGKNTVRLEQAAAFNVALMVTCGVTALATLWLSLASRQRRRYLAILASAPAHPDPIKDGVWGVSVGKFSKQILAVGDDFSASGSGKNTIVRENPFLNMELQAPFVRESSGLDVQCGDAAVLTLAKGRTETGNRTWRSFHYIDSTTPTLVAGRATDKILRKGGEASLIIFASPPNTDVRAELATLRRRELIGGVLALVGVAGFAALFFV
jgi:hypothetical protein